LRTKEYIKEGDELKLRYRELIAERVFTYITAKHDQLSGIEKLVKGAYLDPEVLKCHREMLELYKSKIREKLPDVWLEVLALQSKKFCEEESEGLEEARTNLQTFVTNLSSRNRSTGESYRRLKKYHLNKYGDDSLLTLFPTELVETRSAFITRVIYSFSKYLADKPLTKSSLLEADIEEISLLGERGLGEKSIRLLSLMKNVVIAERQIAPPDLTVK
jgi:hypothetical protein